MKKSLLLSSIMAIVLVIALSTATFAWYTASSNAKVTLSNVQAKTVGGYLQISEKIDNTAAWGGSISLTNTDALIPTSPEEKKIPTNADTKLSSIAEDTNWYSGSATLKADGSDYDNVVTATTTALWKTKTFYVRNGSGDDALIYVKVTVDVPTTDSTTADANLKDNGIAWVLLAKEGPNKLDSDPTKEKQYKVVANSSYNTTTTSGTRVDGNTENDTIDVSVAASALNAKGQCDTGVTLSGVTSATTNDGEVVEFVLLYWIDGWKAVNYGDKNSEGGEVSFTLEFAASDSEVTA